MLLRTPYLITFDPERPFLNDAGILIKGNRIEKIDKFADMSEEYPDEELCDLSGKAVIPGLVNIHTHFYGNFARGITLATEPPRIFSEILERLWWRLDKVLDEESIRLSALIGLVDGIRAGVTSYFDHHASPNCITGSLDMIADETVKAGVRACLCYEVSDRDGEEKTEKGLFENKRFIDRCKKENSSFLSALFGLHAPMTLSDETLAKAMEIGGRGFHIHVAEGIEDVDENMSKYGLRPLERLSKHGMLTKDSIFAHCIHLNDEEVSLLASSGAVQAHNPESNLNNAVGFTDILPRIKAGVRLGLGTDGFSQGLWHGLRQCYLMPKYLEQDPRIAYGELFDVLAVNSARGSEAFGLTVGKIKEGGAADFAAIPYDPPTIINEGNILGHLVFGLMESMVSDVICAGKFIMKNRKILTLNESEIMERSRKCSVTLWDRFKNGIS